MDALYRPMAVLIGQPWLAAIPGAVLLALWTAVRGASSWWPRSPGSSTCRTSTA